MGQNLLWRRAPEPLHCPVLNSSRKVRKHQIGTKLHESWLDVILLWTCGCTYSSGKRTCKNVIKRQPWDHRICAIFYDMKWSNVFLFGKIYGMMKLWRHVHGSQKRHLNGQFSELQEEGSNIKHKEQVTPVVNFRFCAVIFDWWWWWLIPRTRWFRGRLVVSSCMLARWWR